MLTSVTDCSVEMSCSNLNYGNLVYGVARVYRESLDVYLLSKASNTPEFMLRLRLGSDPGLDSSLCVWTAHN